MTTPEPDAMAVLNLTAIIQDIPLWRNRNADALAEAILAHPGSRWQSAAPPDRDASIEAAWGDTTPAEAMEGLRRLAGELAAPEVPPELVPVRYLVKHDKEDSFIDEVVIVRALNGWAVKNDPLRLSIDGAWDVEPMPSFRTREWIIRHTFDTIRAAYEALLKAKEEQP